MPDGEPVVEECDTGMMGVDCDSSGGELKSKEHAGGFAGLGGATCDASSGELGSKDGATAKSGRYACGCDDWMTGANMSS